MKYKCSKCKVLKSDDNFYFSKGKVNGWCKECFRKDHRNKYSPLKGQTDDVRNVENVRKNMHRNNGPSHTFALEIARIKIEKRKIRPNELLPNMTASA
jgi:hypothetical protein